MASRQERAMAADDPDKFKRYARIDASGTVVFYTMYDAAMMLSGARAGWRETEDVRESLSPAAKQWIPFPMLRGPGRNRHVGAVPGRD
jgi:hypothetical protein